MNSNVAIDILVVKIAILTSIVDSERCGHAPALKALAGRVEGLVFVDHHIERSDLIASPGPDVCRRTRVDGTWMDEAGRCEQASSLSLIGMVPLRSSAKPPFAISTDPFLLPEQRSWKTG